MLNVDVKFLEQLQSVLFIYFTHSHTKMFLKKLLFVRTFLICPNVEHRILNYIKGKNADDKYNNVQYKDKFNKHKTVR